MWPCPSCGTSNEPHMIFCSSCGAMRHKPPARAPLSPLPAEPVAAPAFLAPRFRLTVGSFTMRWVGATLAGALVATLVQSFLFTAVLSTVTSSLGPTGTRVFNLLLSTILYGSAIGVCQGLALSRALAAPRVRWLEATLAGTFVGGLAGFLQPDRLWQARVLPDMLLWAGFLGIVGGAARGLFQSLALRRLGRVRGLVFWPVMSAIATALGGLAGAAVWHAATQRQSMNAYVFTGIARTLVSSFLVALPTGAFLGYCLRREFGGSGDIDDE